MLNIIREQIKTLEDHTRDLIADVNDFVLVKRLPPQEVWNQSEGKMADLKDLLENLKKSLLLINAGKAPTIERLFQEVTESFDSFKKMLTVTEGIEPEEEPRVILDRFRETSIAISNFLSLAKIAMQNPDPIIEEILSLKSDAVTSRTPKDVKERFEKSYREEE